MWGVPVIDRCNRVALIIMIVAHLAVSCALCIPTFSTFHLSHLNLPATRGMTWKLCLASPPAHPLSSNPPPIQPPAISYLLPTPPTHSVRSWRALLLVDVCSMCKTNLIMNSGKRRETPFFTTAARKKEKKTVGIGTVVKFQLVHLRNHKTKPISNNFCIRRLPFT